MKILCVFDAQSSFLIPISLGVHYNQTDDIAVLSLFLLVH